MFVTFTNNYLGIDHLLLHSGNIHRIQGCLKTHIYNTVQYNTIRLLFILRQLISHLIRFYVSY